MAACVVFGNACKIGSPATTAASGGGTLFFRKDQIRRNLSMNGFNFSGRVKRGLIVRADSTDSDCNDEECAPEKEIGTVSMDWVAEEKTKVIGTYPPLNRKRGWTGYVEKDTAGQTNIYSVEPAVYVAESAISSGSAGSSSDGAENTAAIAAGIGLISVAAASSILLQVGKNSPPQIQTVMEYSGPSLSYYINKFKAEEIVQAALAPEVESTEASVPAPDASPAEVAEVQLPESAETSSRTEESSVLVPEVSPAEVAAVQLPESTPASS